MTDLSAIKNAHLRELMEKSIKFNALSEQDQAIHLERMVNLPQDKQEDLCRFFIDENEKEGSEKVKQAQILAQMYDKVLDLQKDFQKLMQKDKEEISQKGDEEKMTQLLKEI